MGKVTPRDISPILQKFRDFFFGRHYINALRFEDNLATRSPPLPELPDGPAHKFSANYYYARDARREVEPPLEIAGGQARIVAGEKTGEVSTKSPTPGKLYRWD